MVCNMILKFLTLCAVFAGSASGLDIVEIARRFALNNFVFALEEAQLTDVVRNLQGVTVFAPSDDAFRRVPGDVVKNWTDDLTSYQNALKHHILKVRLNSTQLKDEGVYATFHDGYSGRFNVYNHTSKKKMADIPTYLGSVVSQIDILASNGIIHVINQVALRAEPDHTDLYDAFGQEPSLSNLTSYLNTIVKDWKKLVPENTTTPKTFLAPSNEAFGKLSADVRSKLLNNSAAFKVCLDGHVLPRGSYFSNGWIDGELVPVFNSTTTDVNLDRTVKITKDSDKIRVNDNINVVSANNPVSNGVYHIIDTLITDDACKRALGITN